MWGSKSRCVCSCKGDFDVDCFFWGGIVHVGGVVLGDVCVLRVPSHFTSNLFFRTVP